MTLWPILAHVGFEGLVEEGSIRMVLSGSTEGLKKLQDLYNSGELEALDIPYVETVQPVDNDTTGARKARLVEVLKLRGPDFLLARALANNFSRARARPRANNRANNLSRARDSARNLYNDLIPALTSVARARDLVLDSDLAHDLVRDLVRARDFDSDSAFARLCDLNLAHDSAFARARDLSRALARVRACAHDSALTEADLKGTNLSNINLVGVDLTGADLTGANVQGTVFGDNEGLLESVKRDLQKRGAIFQDSPGSDVPSLVRV